MENIDPNTNHPSEEGNKLDTKFKCDKCSKGFSTDRNLCFHIRNAHTLREKVFFGFQCKICQMRTAYRKSVMDHLSQVHDISKESIDQNVLMVDQMTTLQSGVNLTCEACF